MITTIVNLLTFGILFSSIISITSNNPIISIIFLITAFVNAAGYLILLGINFIGISYIVIYVGAIAVLFLFIILMINIKLTDILDTGYNFTKNLPLGLNIASLLLFIFFSVAAQVNLFPFFLSPLVKESCAATLNYEEVDTISAFPWDNITSIFQQLQAKVGGESLELESKVAQVEDILAFSQNGLPISGEEIIYNNYSNLPYLFSREMPEEILDGKLLEFTQIEVLGQFLYTYASIFLIILSLILLLAMLAIIIISKKNITNI